MTWPSNPTRAEVLRILEVNRNNFHHWVISREETAVLIGLLRDGAEMEEWIARAERKGAIDVNLLSAGEAE